MDISQILEIIKAIAIGFAIGAIFVIFKTPIPAPPVIAGVAGIFGIYLGGLIIGMFWK